MASMRNEDRFVWDLLEDGEYEGLMAACPSTFVFHSENNPYGKCPPLIRVCMDFRASLPLVEHVLQWLIDRGEDPAVMAPPGCGKKKHICKKGNREKTTLHFCAAGHSAMSFALSVRRQFKEQMKKHICDWSDNITRFDRILKILYSACGKANKRDKLPIDASIVNRWAQMREHSATHDVILQTDQGLVGAHTSIITLASPVLHAMMSSSMVEAEKRQIIMKDTSKAAVELFLDVLYTGCISGDASSSSSSYAPPGVAANVGFAADSSVDLSVHSLDGAGGSPSLAALLGAHEIAHRWQASDVHALLESFLAGTLNERNFGHIAEVAHLRGSSKLVDACVGFATHSQAVQATIAAGGYSMAVLELCGKYHHSTGEPSRKRLRAL